MEYSHLTAKMNSLSTCQNFITFAVDHDPSKLVRILAMQFTLSFLDNHLLLILRLLIPVKQ